MLTAQARPQAATPAPAWLRLLPCCLPVVIGLVLFTSTGPDDSHITYWPAYTLARYGEMVNYNGARLEQSSSLALVLLLACLAKLGPIALATTAAVVSALAGMITVLLTQRLAARVDRRLVLPAGLLAGTSLCVVYWAWSGMETTLAAASGAWLANAYIDFIDAPGPRHTVTAVGATLLFLLVRPENLVVAPTVLIAAATISAFHILRARGSESSVPAARLRREIVLLVIAVIGIISVVAFRFLYFGSPLPEPVFAKSGGLSLRSLRIGAVYVMRGGFLESGAPLFVLAMSGFALLAYQAWRTATVAMAQLVPALFGVTVLAFVVCAGGDWMESGRFLVPAIPFVVVIGLLALRRAIAGRAWVVSIAALVLLQIAGNVRFAFDISSEGAPWWIAMTRSADIGNDTYSWFERTNRGHIRDIVMTEHVREWVDRTARVKQGAVSLMSGQMGFIAFHLASTHYGRVHVIDRYGLVTPDFGDCSYGEQLPRTSHGFDFPLERFFEQRAIIRRLCDLADPDIIFEVHRSNEAAMPKLLQGNGYVVVFEQPNQVLAVRTDLHALATASRATRVVAPGIFLPADQ